MAWTEANDDVAFLWLDRNGNGVADGGMELENAAGHAERRHIYDVSLVTLP